MHVPRLSATPDIISVHYLGDGVDAIKETLRIMRRIVRVYRRDPTIRAIAREATQFLPGKEWAAQAQVLLDWVRNNIRYTLDTNGEELLHTPDKLIEKGAGDCDDMSVLVASLLESIGHPTRFVACGFAPGELSHVYVETLIGDSYWAAIDCTENGNLGWSPPGQVERFVFHV